MARKLWLASVLVLMFITPGFSQTKTGQPEKIKLYNAQKEVYEDMEKVNKTEAEWKMILTPVQFNVTRKKGTERAFSGEYWNNHRKGVYACIGCGTDLYHSQDKFESGTGWPSFTRPIAPENVATRDDDSFFSHRTEVYCPRCGAHLGHVFDDGPAPTHQRYCMNSAALKFVEDKK